MSATRLVVPIHVQSTVLTDLNMRGASAPFFMDNTNASQIW
jgi:hypothetical protein